MMNPRAQVVMRVTPINAGDEHLITETLLRIEGVRAVEERRGLERPPPILNEILAQPNHLS